jgi:hypothetical protein
VSAVALRARVILRNVAADARMRPWPWLLLVVAVAVLAGLVYTSRLASFFVQTDEMTYFKSSYDIWQTKGLLHPGAAYFSTWGQLAPLLRAPAFAFGSALTAFDLSHVINVFAFASSAIPVYLLARPLVRWTPLAVLAAALSVSIPWLAITGTMLAEPMAYPAFCWALLGIQRSVARPSPKNDVLAFAGIALAFFGRTQFASLVPALLLAVLLHEVAYPLAVPDGRPRRQALADGLRAAARRHALLLGLVVIGALMLLAVGKDRIVGDTLGSYQQTAYGSLIPYGTRQVAVEMISIVGIGCGVLPLPFTLAWMLRTAVKPLDREAHAFTMVAFAVGLVLAVVVGSYVVRFTAGPGLSDRYMFYLAPILFVGMLACLGTLWRAPVALALGGLLALAIYHGHQLFEAPGSALSPAGPFHVQINAHLANLPFGMQASTALGIFALVASLAFAVPRHLVEPRIVAAVAGGVLLAFCGYETAWTLRNVSNTQAHAPQSYLQTRNWVDQHLPANANVAALLGEVYDAGTTPAAWWEAIFFNDTVHQPYYDLADATQPWGQTAVVGIKVNERTGAVTGLENVHYVLHSTDDRRWTLEGAKPVAQVGNLVLQSVPAVKRVPWTFRTSDQAGRIHPGELGTLHVFRGPARRRTLTIAGPPSGKPIVVRISDARGRRAITLGPTQTQTVPVRPVLHGGRGPGVVTLRSTARPHGQSVQVTAIGA